MPFSGLPGNLKGNNSQERVLTSVPVPLRLVQNI